MLTPSRPARPVAGHVPALDGVRGVAVLLVLAHNFNVLADGGSAVARAVGLFMDWGWVGVQLFFVLSGFLITGILLESKRATNYYRVFFARRVVRIFPIYYAVLIATFVIAPLVLGHQVEGAEHQVYLWTYVANWAEPFGAGVALFPHFWSLSIEEQFYLVWPVVVRRLSPRGLLWVCVGLVVASLASRIALRAVDFATTGPYMFTICRVDALALGAIAAVLLRRPEVAAQLDRRRWALRAAVAVTIAVTFVATRGAPRTGLGTQTWGYTAFAVAFAALVLDATVTAARRDLLGRVLAVAPLRSVGRYSYAMYIFHTPLHLLIGLPALQRALGDGDRGLGVAVGYFAIATAATYVLALASYHLLEKHFLRLKRRYVIEAAAA